MKLLKKKKLTELNVLKDKSIIFPAVSFGGYCDMEINRIRSWAFLAGNLYQLIS